MKKLLLLFLGFLMALSSCRAKESNLPNSTFSDDSATEIQQKRNDDIPQKVWDTYRYIKKNNRAQNGYVGGRKFGNYEKLLPIKNEKGQKVNYREWDVNPKKKGKNRGAQRLVTSNDGHAYYTSDHYRSFKKLE